MSTQKQRRVSTRPRVQRFQYKTTTVQHNHQRVQLTWITRGLNQLRMAKAREHTCATRYQMDDKGNNVRIWHSGRGCVRMWRHRTRRFFHPWTRRRREDQRHTKTQDAFTCHRDVQKVPTPFNKRTRQLSSLWSIFNAVEATWSSLVQRLDDARQHARLDHLRYPRGIILNQI